MYDPLSLLGLRENGEFCTTLRCKPLEQDENALHKYNSANAKLILPMSALQKLATSTVEYPMVFKLTNVLLDLSTHAGVLEFTADEGCVQVPKWIQNTLLLERDDLVMVERVTLPQGKFVKIEPQSVDFLEISNPKAALEIALVNFPTLSKNDKILFEYNSKIFEIVVLEIKPDGPGISIIETDLEVEFAPPVGYVLPTPQDALTESRKKTALKMRSLVAPSAGSTSSAPKSRCVGTRLSGKRTRRSITREAKSKEKEEEHNLDLDPEAPINLAEGQLFFGYPLIPYTADPNESGESNNNNVPT